MCELRREGNVGDRHVIKNDVEAARTQRQILTHKTRDHFSLRDQLRCIKLRDDGLEYFVHNAWQHTLVVVGAKLTIDRWQIFDAWA